MSTFSGDIGPEEEDGGGWEGLVPTREERERERHMHDAKRLEELCIEAMERESKRAYERFDSLAFAAGFWAGVHSIEAREVVKNYSRSATAAGGGAG